MKTINKYNCIKKKNLFDVIEQILKVNTSTNILVPFVSSDNIDFSNRFIKASFDRYKGFETNFTLNKPVIGKVDFFNVKTTKYKNSIIFASMPCHHMKSYGRKINYGELASCMHQIKNTIKRSKTSNDEFKIEIHSPKFGTGVSGGDWRIISELINDVWSNLGVFIYEP